MRTAARKTRLGPLRLLVAASALAALCSSCLNPAVVNQNGGDLYPLAPGDQPFLQVTVVNDTLATIDIPIGYDDGHVPLPKPIRITGLSPAARTSGVLLDWPVFRVGIGNVDDPLIAITGSIVARFPDGSTISVPPQLPALTADVDYKRGDAIIFRLVSDARSPTFISTSLGKIDAATQTGPFRREDTFLVVNQLIQLPAP